MKHWKFILFYLVGSALLLLLPFFSGKFIPFSVLFLNGGGEKSILFSLRIPRIILAIITGGGLSIAGLVFQSLFRNSLASPYTLGVASGASFMVVLFMHVVTVSGILFHGGIILVAFLGGNLSIFLIYFLSRASGQIHPHRMILAGVALTFFFSGLITVILFYSSFANAYQMLRWMMGGLDILGYKAFSFLIPISSILILILYVLVKPLNIMSTSHEFAYSKGVDVQKYQRLVFWIASFLTATIVSITGPIAFVGLMIPHIARLLFGANLRAVFVPTFFLGAIFLALIDSIGKYIFYPMDFPVGVLTGLLGGPFFVWLLYKEKMKT